MFRLGGFRGQQLLRVTALSVSAGGGGEVSLTGHSAGLAPR